MAALKYERKLKRSKRKKDKQVPHRFAYYCNICHQQFDHPRQHGAGSYDDQGNRLNGYCPGDIRSVEIEKLKSPNHLPNPTIEFKRYPPSILSLSGEPIVIK
jgi:hypothetical protein